MSSKTKEEGDNVFESYMWKFTKNLGGNMWRKRWFKLSQDGKLFYYKNKMDFETFLSWTESLEHVGGVNDRSFSVDLEDSDPQKNRFINLHVREWNHEDCMQFLKWIPSGDPDQNSIFALYGDFFDVQKKFDGKELMKTKNRVLKMKFRIVNILHRRSLLDAIRSLVREDKGHFNLGFYIVLRKLNFISPAKTDSVINQQGRKLVAKNLSDVKYNMASYLNLESKMERKKSQGTIRRKLQPIPKQEEEVKEPEKRQEDEEKKEKTANKKKEEDEEEDLKPMWEEEENEEMKERIGLSSSPKEASEEEEEEEMVEDDPNILLAQQMSSTSLRQPERNLNDDISDEEEEGEEEDHNIVDVSELSPEEEEKTEKQEKKKKKKEKVSNLPNKVKKSRIIAEEEASSQPVTPTSTDKQNITMDFLNLVIHAVSSSGEEDEDDDESSDEESSSEEEEDDEEEIITTTTTTEKHENSEETTTTTQRKKSVIAIPTRKFTKEELRKKRKVKVKLVVTEVAKSKKARTFRQFVSPVMNKVSSLKTEFGVFHTAIIVGPWYLDWNNSSLVVPRRISSGMAILTADLDSTPLEQFSLEEITEKISQVICKWNTTKYYKTLNFEKVKKWGNCQEFVEDIMEVLKLRVDKNGVFGRFLKQLKTTGRASLEFCPSQEFRARTGLNIGKQYKKKQKWVFKSHQELDTMMNSMLEYYEKEYVEEDEEYVLMEQSEIKLLKSFDRAFWLRHIRNPSDHRYKPLTRRMNFTDTRHQARKMRMSGRRMSFARLKGGHCLCPFKDPRRTNSFLQGF